MKNKIYKNNGLTFIEIVNKKMKVTFCNLGASIYSIYFNEDLMTKTLSNSKDFYNADIYHGKTIGRTSNRIKGNVIKIDNKEYKLENNEGMNTLHGGKDGLSTKFFDYKINKNQIIFTYLSKDKESGFPGNLNVEIIYKINIASIKCNIAATSDQNTLCNLTNHTYFTLAEKDLFNTYLKIKADKYLKVSEDELLPKEIKPVFKEIDFRRLKLISSYIDSPKIKKGKANGYDHNFYLNNINSKKPELFLKGSKYMLSIITDFPCCQIYTDNYETPYKWLGLKEAKRNSIAIEPQDDFLNRKILKVGECYQRYIIYKFKQL